jgi:O-antigen ligase
MGNGLGGGGNSIPHFLLHLVRNPMPVENQYATIMLEQGLPGLLVWLAFIVWTLTRPLGPRTDPWHFPRLLARVACALYLATGFIGVGLFTAVPFSAMLFMWMAWLNVQPRREAEAPVPLRAAHPAEPRLAYRHA